MSPFKISHGLYKEFLRTARWARKGILSQENWDDFRLQLSYSEEWAFRLPWVRQVSWPIITIEYIDSLASIIPKNFKVLEVCAGPIQRRIIANAMKFRGYSWTATDLLTGEDAFHLNYTPYDLVYASWIPYGLSIDLHVARTQKPFIFLGERHGCTGSTVFWDIYEDSVSSEKAGFVDVPQFNGLHDFTSFLNF